MFFRSSTPQKSTKSPKKSRKKASLASRRQFLRGAGGFALALPFLPSLLPRAAWAQSAPTGPKRMVHFASPHGAIWPQDMWPDDSVANQSMSYAGHTVHQGALNVQNNQLSYVLSSSALTQAVADKMFLVNGCDIPFYIGHHSGGHLGNYNRNDLDGGAVVQMANRVTIDQVMRHSPNFYEPGANITRPSIHLAQNGNPDYGTSWGYVNPATKTGVQGMATEMNSLALFNDIFTGGEPTPGPQKVPVVDRVYAQYSQLTSGAFGPANRLSSADRTKLEGYMSHLSQLESKLTAVPSASCGDIPTPTANVDWYDQFTCIPEQAASDYELWNDVIVAAFMCDTSRIVTVNAVETWDLASCNGDAWHQDIAHECGNHPDTIGKVMADAVRFFFDRVYMDLVTKLDAVPTGDGTTLLDDSLVWWSQESGMFTHESVGMPIVAAGGAGGVFTTGRYYDYRNRDNTMFVEQVPDMQVQNLMRPGLLYNQWLGTVLQGMGVPPSEWEQGSVKGYGELANERNYAASILNVASDPLPMMLNS